MDRPHRRFSTIVPALKPTTEPGILTLGAMDADWQMVSDVKVKRLGK